MREDDPSKRVVEQRVRNRLLEYLEMLVVYESESPPFDLNEALNQWEDWVMSPATANSFPEPVYSSGEAGHLVRVDQAWNRFCDCTPSFIVDESRALQLSEWETLMSAANSALAELRKRGRLSEEVEI